MACSIVYQTDKKTGVQYAYESVSYWDPDKKQPRSRRRYLGRVDPETGEIIAKKERSKKTAAQKNTLPASAETASSSILKEKEKEISALKKENAALRRENRSILLSLKKILANYTED